MKRAWKQAIRFGSHIAEQCQWDTDHGWTVFAVVPLSDVREGTDRGNGAAIVSWKDEPDLAGGVPR